MGEDARLYMAYYEGKAIAGTIAIKWGKNVMKYQYGASSNAHRNVYPNYALQWAMMNGALKSAARFTISAESAAIAKIPKIRITGFGDLSTASAAI